MSEICCDGTARISLPRHRSPTQQVAPRSSSVLRRASSDADSSECACARRSCPPHLTIGSNPAAVEPSAAQASITMTWSVVVRSKREQRLMNALLNAEDTCLQGSEQRQEQRKGTHWPRERGDESQARVDMSILSDPQLHDPRRMPPVRQALGRPRARERGHLLRPGPRR